MLTYSCMRSPATGADMGSENMGNGNVGILFVARMRLGQFKRGHKMFYEIFLLSLEEKRRPLCVLRAGKWDP